MRKPPDLKAWIKTAAARLGFDLCGIAPAALPDKDKSQYLWWLEQGFHGEMSYMERQQRQDIRMLFPEVRSVICAGMVYNTAYPKSIDCTDAKRGWISRYGWGDDYHDVLRARLETLLTELRSAVGTLFDAKVYVDTGPLLERTIARAAGLGWVAKNTCLINQKVGSWFMVGEILTSLELEPDVPVDDRCGTCRRCVEACPTQAILEPYVLDATRCIAYFTIEARGSIPEEFRPKIGRHVFGCDICQDVCPWNRKALVSMLPEFQPRRFQGCDSNGAVLAAAQSHVRKRAGADPVEPAIQNPSRDRPAVQSPDLRTVSRQGTDTACRTQESEASRTRETVDTVQNAFNPPLEWLAALTEEQFATLFRKSPVKRAKYRGMLRNVAIAMGNSRAQQYRPVLERLAEYPDAIVQEHACWALEQLGAETVARKAGPSLRGG